MSTPYLNELNRKIDYLKRDRELSRKVYDAFSKGVAIDAPHYQLKDLLIRFRDIDDFLHDLRKRLEEENYSTAYAILGEPGTGKTQLGFFIAHYLNSDNVKVIYNDLKSVEELRQLRSMAQELVRTGYNVVLMLDNLDSFISHVTSTPNGARDIFELGNLVQMLSDRPQVVEGKLRGAAVILLLHYKWFNFLVEKDPRLRRVKELKSLHMIEFDKAEAVKKEVSMKEWEELALSVLAAICAYDESYERALMYGGEDIVKLFVRWSASLLELKGKMPMGLFIWNCFRFFEGVLKGLSRRPPEPIERGRLVQRLVETILTKSELKVVIEDVQLNGQIVSGRSSVFDRPDLELRLYQGLPVGIPVRSFYMEIKSVSSKSSMRQSYEQLVRYAREKPLIVVILAEDVAQVEEEVESLEREHPIVFLKYPLALFEPIVLVSDESMQFNLSKMLDKDIASDVASAIKVLFSRSKVKEEEYGKIEPHEKALEIISKAKLRTTTVRQRKLHDIKEAVKEVLKVEDSAAEKIALGIATSLTKEGFLSRKSEKLFQTVPTVWRDREEGAVEIVSKIIERYQAPLL